MDDISRRLSTVRLGSNTAERGSSIQREEHASACVEVAEGVMAYILQKRREELKTIQGKIVTIDLLSPSSHSGKVRVTFKPCNVTLKPVHANLIRQRFVTFYQRMAADLQIRSISVNPCDQKDLERRFPQLLFEANRDTHGARVMGPLVQIAALEKFLSHQTFSSRQKEPSSGISVASATRGEQPEGELCPICMEVIQTTEKQTLWCKHSFCKGCLNKAFEYKSVCPTCGVLYGTLTGTQPERGTMNVTKNKSSLPGYDQYGTIIIEYYIPSGIQKEEHPNPGQPYKGATRTAYLPDSSEGRKVLDLLRKAFDQRLIFTVGYSSTTGRGNMVTWNDIHHKTSTHGGPTCYGYPDPDYLKRVQQELKLKGIN
ncbi:hypothetical protein LDENG_00194800 [Lucifuga dentata]|nr:hypothetical protein LDENG_00194800 [Lucifuga dentata]